MNRYNRSAIDQKTAENVQTISCEQKAGYNDDKTA